MAGDSALVLTALTLNSYGTLSTKTTDGKQTVLSSTGALTLDVGDYDASKLILLVSANAGVTRPTVVIEDGAYLTGGAQGDIEILTTAGGQYLVGPFESSRFMDSSDKINVTKDTTDTTIVYVQAFLLP